MSADHDRAQRLIALMTADIAAKERDWLNAHLESCDACRNYELKAREVMGALRSFPVTANVELVHSTQRRVRERAHELRLQRDRTNFIWLAIATVVLVSLVSTPLLLLGFEMLGSWVSLPDAIWQSGALIFLAVPVLVVAAFFMARGVEFGNYQNAMRRW
jgi:anti-sigma factor RsiW